MTVKYRAEAPPKSEKGMGDYLETQFSEVEAAIESSQVPDVVEFEELNREPERPRNGMMFFADGTNFNPGSGRGLYVYNGNTGAWVQLLSLP